MKIILIIAGILLIIAGYAIGSFYPFSFFSGKGNGGIACTMEAKLCPDGSAVGRTGPKCEFAPCPEVKTGTLKGKISIGPLCPVERVPPDPRCQATEETYKAWPIAVLAADGKTKIAQIKPALDGNYQLELPAGNYIVNLEKQSIFGNNLPTNITIKKGETTALDIDIDTGIR